MAFYFIKKAEERFDISDIRFTMHCDSTVDNMVQEFTNFLKACGYEIQTGEIIYERRRNDTSDTNGED